MLDVLFVVLMFSCVSCGCWSQAYIWLVRYIVLLGVVLEKFNDETCEIICSLDESLKINLYAHLTNKATNTNNNK